MVVVESSHPAGVIGFTGAELARYHHFTAAWAEVQVPQGTLHQPGLGYDTACNSNDIIRYAMGKPDAQWVWIMDDDHLFDPGTLMALLDANVDVVIPLYAQRVPPFRPCVFGAETEQGWPILSWADLEGKSGLMPIASGGKGGILIRRRVLEAMARESNPEWLVVRDLLNKEPKGTQKYDDLAHVLTKQLRAPSWFEWDKGRIGEDHTFFKKALRLGFQPHVHLDVALGHLSTMGIWPHNKDGKWCGRVNIGANAFVEYWDKKYADAPIGVQE